MDLYEHCTSKMVTEGARALDLWSDESLREEIDNRRMAELVWKAMAPHSNCRGAVDLLREIALSGVEFDDSRLGYVTVQIDRPTWDALATHRGQQP